MIKKCRVHGTELSLQGKCWECELDKKFDVVVRKYGGYFLAVIYFFIIFFVAYFLYSYGW